MKCMPQQPRNTPLLPLALILQPYILLLSSLPMSPAQQHPEIRPHNRIKCRNARSAACQQISYMVCTLGGMLTVLELAGLNSSAKSVNSL